jgi:hypothetical protein
MGTGRTVCGCAVGMLILGQGLLAAPKGDRPEPRAEFRATLDVILKHPQISGLTASVMREEVERIWLREGVHLRWHLSQADVPADARFIGLELVDEYLAVAADGSATTLGHFRPGAGTIRISLRSAEATTTLGLSGFRRPLQPFDHPLALGYVLGRAIAHEIGHSLLGAAHSETGLMQAAFTPSQMIDRLSGRFRLAPDDSARLFHRLDDGRIALSVRAADRPPLADSLFDADRGLAQ